ncbi:hypothetical protein ACIU1J_32390 [Azospirillum doebereinerae]|uniref:hypothetical protein n=1 Tax=Azospirillum doebereinerae TaxID=92933 RepID=UPI001EE5EDF0|nr:hypothetical protein [Azospirillum doebereinerae]MCG5243965.1 hypothetical protein [Azospirillum doebereinerae]
MGKPFNFAAIFGRRNRADEAGPEDNSVNEGEGEDNAASEDEEQGGGANEGEGEDNAASEDEEQGGANEDDPPPATARASAAERRIRASERERIGRITTSKAAVGRAEAAMSLAINTNMSAAAAIALLGTLPAGASAPTKGGLSDRMRGVSDGVPPDRGGGGGTPPAGPMSFKQIQARRMDRAASAGTRTPRR